MSLGEYTVNPSSPIAVPPALRDVQKSANDPSDEKKTEKMEMFPAVALGYRPTPPVSDPLITSADFYRNGRAGAFGSDYQVQPRVFDSFEEGGKQASIRIFGQGPKDDKPRDFIPPYTKFFLEGVQESHVERSQIVETFGKSYVFFFGERPPIYNFTGQLVNSRNANWVSDFMFMYETYLRGTRCTELNASAILTYGGRQIEGFIMNVSTSTNSMIEGAVNLSFQVVVTERKYLGFSDDMGFASTEGGDLSFDEKFLEMLDQIAGKSGKGTSGGDQSKAIQQGNLVMNGRAPASGVVVA